MTWDVPIQCRPTYAIVLSAPGCHLVHVGFDRQHNQHASSTHCSPAAVTTESVVKLIKNLLLAEKAERREKQKEEARQRASRWTTEAALCSLT